MMVAATLALMLFAWGESASDPRPSAPDERSITIRQQIIIRVPQGPGPRAPAGGSLLHWKEGAKVACVDADRIAGATMLGPRSFDLVLRDNRRVRAKMGRRCPALDYYYGFYVPATADGRICADRDFVRSRMGGECAIDEFRALRPSPR